MAGVVHCRCAGVLPLLLLLHRTSEKIPDAGLVCIVHDVFVVEKGWLWVSSRPSHAT